MRPSNSSDAKAKSLLVERLNRGRAYVTADGLGPFLVRSVAGSGVVRIASMVASFVVGVLLARGLGVKGYGYYGLALSVLTIAGIPSELGIPRVVTREIAASLARNDQAAVFGVLRWSHRVCLTISVIIGLCAAAAGVVLFSRGSTILGTTLIAGAPLIPLETMAHLKGGALQGLHHVVLGQMPINLLRPMLMAAILVPLMIAGFALVPWTAMALYSATAGGVVVLSDIWLRKRLPPAVPARLVEEGRRWLASSIPIALADGMRVLQTELSVLLMGLMAAPAEVGLFKIAGATAITAAAPFTIIARVAFPVMARLHADNDTVRLQKTVTALAWTQFVIVVLMAVPLIVFPDLLLRLVFGQQFTGAAMALRIMSAGQIANAIFGPNTALLLMTNKERRVTRAMAIALALNLITIPPLVLTLGVVGAAIAYTISVLCWNVATWIDGKRLLGIDTSVFRMPRLRNLPV